MKRAPGFTLIELLVVIAIITILAGIMVPRVGPMIAKARMARSAAEIHNIELSLTSMLADAGKKSFSHIWTVTAAADLDPDTGVFGDPDRIGDAMKIYEQAFYCLLRLGSGAPDDAQWPNKDGSMVDVVGQPALTLRPEVVQSIGKNYMDLGNDPWGNRYQFCPGPLRHKPMPFRVYDRPDPTIPGLPPIDGGEVPYTDIETGETHTVGYPASKNMTIYIFSKGQNLESNQLWSSTYLGTDASADYAGGGDDIVNWDEAQSFKVHYN